MDDVRRFLALVEHITMEGAVSTLLVLQAVALLTIPSVLLRRRGRPTSALAWLMVLISLPALGVLAWWIFGRTRMERRLRKHRRSRRNFSERNTAPKTMRGTQFEGFLPQRAHGQHAFSSGGNLVRLLPDGDLAFSVIEKEIRAAKKHVHLLFYIFKNDETGDRFCQLLIECVERGVKVRLLLDGFTNRNTAPKLRKKLEPHGVEVGVFFPTRFWPLTPRLNFVNHRKIITIDDRIGFTGGMNIGRQYEKEWRDLMVRLEGPAVQGLNHVFLEDWFFATESSLKDPKRAERISDADACDVGIVSSGPDSENWIHDAYFLAITQAQERLYISSPYFIPTPAISSALRTAAGRGVDVRIVLPALSDVRLVMWASRSFYRELVSAGVRIFEYEEGMLHAKALVIDDELATVGTANVDNRSFLLNFEVTCMVAQRRINSELREWLEALFAKSSEITEESLNKKSTPRKLLESAAHLASPLL